MSTFIEYHSHFQTVPNFFIYRFHFFIVSWNWLLSSLFIFSNMYWGIHFWSSLFISLVIFLFSWLFLWVERTLLYATKISSVSHVFSLLIFWTHENNILYGCKIILMQMLCCGVFVILGIPSPHQSCKNHILMFSFSSFPLPFLCFAQPTSVNNINPLTSNSAISASQKHGKWRFSVQRINSSLHHSSTAARSLPLPIYRHKWCLMLFKCSKKA